MKIKMLPGGGGGGILSNIKNLVHKWSDWVLNIGLDGGKQSKQIDINKSGIKQTRILVTFNLVNRDKHRTTRFMHIEMTIGID